MFSRLVDQGAFLAHEKQMHLAEMVGDHERWDVDLDVPSLTYTFADRTLVCATQLLGSSAPGPGTWLWGWANDSVSGAGTELAHWLRGVGERDGITELCFPEIPIGPEGNEPPDAFWYRLMCAVAVLAPSWHGYYASRTGGGTVGPLVVAHPSLALPAPKLLRVSTVLAEGIAAVSITDHRAAVAGYASLRGVGCTWTGEGCTLTVPETSPDGRLTLTFDEMNRITSINGTFGPADV